MPDTSGTATKPLTLVERLEAEPFRFGFYQAMRLLEARYRNNPRFGTSARPAQDAIRLGQEASVAFAPSALASYRPAQDGRKPLLRIRFFGLFGPNGPLPLHLTEYARNRDRNEHDPTFLAFADMFHHRAISLFYRAWAVAQPTVAFDRPEDDRYSCYVGSLLGLGTNALRCRDAMPDLAKLHFAGHLANRTRHAEGLGAILSEFFAMPVRVACFIGDWLTLPDSDRSRLGDGARTMALGQTSMLGGRVWSRQHKFRVVFGPLDLVQYERLLPGGLSFHRLVPIVRNYAGDTLSWDVNLILKRAEVPATSLGRQGRLGWTTWLSPRRNPGDAADLFLNASADSFAARIDAAAELPNHQPEHPPLPDAPENPVPADLTMTPEFHQ